VAVKDTLEEAGKIWSTLGVIKAFCGSLACIGVGVLLVYGPPEVREEISFHKDLGYAFLGFGGLFFVVLIGHGCFPRSSIYYRSRSLLLAIVFGLIATGLGFALLRQVGGARVRRGGDLLRVCLSREARRLHLRAQADGAREVSAEPE
jgi:hypothetical protein